MKLHIDDNVLVISGKYRKKTGKILRTSAKHNQVVVEKINIRTKHIKKHAGQAGQKIQYEAPLSASNVMVICPNCSKATRLKVVFLKDGARQRVCKKCGQSVDRTIEKKQTKKR